MIVSSGINKEFIIKCMSVSGQKPSLSFGLSFKGLILDEDSSI